jgi:glycosyltransferase involved in cell wall biosynthesis
MEVGIVSIFPKGSTHGSTGGIQGYTKGIAVELSKLCNVTVFSEKKDNESKSTYIESGIRVIMCWNRGILYALQIWLSSLKYRIDIFHVQHEYFIYGGIFSAMIFPLLLLLLRARAPVVVTIHALISRAYLEKLETTRGKLLNLFRLFILKINLKQICWLSDQIIVHNNYLKEVLMNEYGIRKSSIIVINHGIEVKDALEPKEAKGLLNISSTDKVILFFGYLSARKGVEILVDSFVKIRNELPDTILIIGAGKNPRLKEQSEYMDYFNSIQRYAESIPNIYFTGFIPEDRLSIYISAADVIVFPYSAPVAASGPLHISLGFNKLVLCSDIPIFREMITTEKLLFKADCSEDLYTKLKYILSLSVNKKSDILQLITHLRNNHSWPRIAERTIATYKMALAKDNEHM